MHYALLIHEDYPDAYPDGETGQAWRDIFHAHIAYGGERAQAGVMIG
ncbi:MAG: hypothetical protein IOB84_03240, partial [Brevundimonas sp.]|nr:hypothetical protein [Brevundimonas sp.]